MLLSPVSEKEIERWGINCGLCGKELSNGHGLRVHLAMVHSKEYQVERSGSRDLPFKERVLFYKKALELQQKKGWGYRRISRYLGIKKRLVQEWVCRGRNPFSRFHHPQLVPSASLSYVVGVYYGDGWAFSQKSAHRYVVGLAAKDEDFVDEFARCLSEVLEVKRCSKYEYEIERGGKTKSMFRVVKSSAFLLEYLKKGLNEHKKSISAYPADFLRGLFDSEGSFALGEIRCRMSNREVLEWAQKLLRKLDIKSSIRLEQEAGRITNFYGDKCTSNKPQYCLSIGTQRGMVKFAERVGSSIERKRKVLKQIIASYSQAYRSK